MKKCRYDWFQSGEHVALSVFAKCIDPARTKVLANKNAVRQAGTSVGHLAHTR
jgi:hypothetical protein